jgi:hypothetical protein
MARRTNLKHRGAINHLEFVKLLCVAREFKAIFFDLDGTLVDIHGPLYIAARNALDQLGQQRDASE